MMAMSWVALLLELLLADCCPEPVPGVARRNDVSRIRRRVLGVGVTVVLVTVVGRGTSRSADLQRSAPAAAGAASERRTITIDPQVGETFAPAPASAVPKLTAQQAWARYMRQNGDDHTAIPPFVRVQLGLLTLPIGPTGPGGAEAYTAHNDLVYGYSSPSGCVSMNPRVLFLPGAHCISWDFLNANTGKQIDSTWQKIGHWHVLTNPIAP
jgi:hypothetical protein